MNDHQHIRYEYARFASRLTRFAHKLPLLSSSPKAYMMLCSLILGGQNQCNLNNFMVAEKVYATRNVFLWHVCSWYFKMYSYRLWAQEIVYNNIFNAKKHSRIWFASHSATPSKIWQFGRPPQIGRQNHNFSAMRETPSGVKHCYLSRFSVARITVLTVLVCFKDIMKKNPWNWLKNRMGNLGSKLD